MLPLFLMRWCVRPAMMQGHHHDRQPVVKVNVCLAYGLLVLQVPIGEQQEVPLWCHSCFWMVVMVKDGVPR
jgi:hypothetical protein